MAYDIVYEKDNVQIQKITETVYFRYITHAPVGAAIGNGAYILFGGRLFAVDAPSSEQFMLMMREAQEVFGKPIDTVLISHPHIDHIEGLPEVLKAGVSFVASRVAADWLAAGDDRYQNGTGVEGKLVLQGGGERIELLTFEGFNHSRGDMFICLPKQGVMVTGDSVVLPQYIYISDGDFENWYSVVCRLAQLPYSVFLPGHGVVNDADVFKQVLGYFCDLRSAVRYQLSRMSPDEIAIDTHEHARQVSDTVLSDPGNKWGARLIEQGLERKVREHVVDVYRLFTGRKQFPRYNMVVPK